MGKVIHMHDVLRGQVFVPLHTLDDDPTGLQYTMLKHRGFQWQEGCCYARAEVIVETFHPGHIVETETREVTLLNYLPVSVIGTVDEKDLPPQPPFQVTDAYPGA